jgi:hexosaminidase
LHWDVYVNMLTGEGLDVYRITMRLFRLASVVALALPVALPMVAQAPLHLIPMPREVTRKADLPIANGASVVCNSCDAEDRFAADDLQATLAERGVSNGGGAGLRIELVRGGADFSPAMKPEGYTIAVGQGAVTLTGATASGVFYAAQTLKQMIERELDGRFVLRAADIRDWPAMTYRGLSDDLSRGPVDSLEFQKKLIRTLAAYKDNLYSPYFENTQQYLSNPLPSPPGGSISPADARELVAYAAKYHVMVVPEQEAFGHLRHALVYEEYSQLAETPHGAVLAPGQAGSLAVIKQMFTELATMYPSPFLHVGADETVDLGLGQTKDAVDAKGLGQVYLDFMQQVDTTLKPLNRKLLFWGDIAEHSPDLLKAMPADFKKDTVAIGWEYNPNPKGFSQYLKPFLDAGFETWVAPGINNWNRVYPNYNMGLANIQQFTRDGQKASTPGQLNTLWYDDGEALASNNWYGILFGCAAAWQQGESSIPQFENDYAEVFHGDLTGKLNQAQLEIMAAHDLLKTQSKVSDGSDLLFWSDPWAKDQQDNVAKLRPYLHDLRLHAEKALDLIAQARAAYPVGTTTVVYSATNQLPSNPTTLRETDAIDALELGARRLDFIGLKFQLADEMAQNYADAAAGAVSQNSVQRRHVSGELSNINGVNGRIQDIKDGYSMIRDLYAQSWLRTNRPYALRPVLEHYDYTIGIWLARMDKVRSAQRQWADSKTLPSAADVGIPAPPPPATPLQMTK